MKIRLQEGIINTHKVCLIFTPDNGTNTFHHNIDSMNVSVDLNVIKDKLLIIKQNIKNKLKNKKLDEDRFIDDKYIIKIYNDFYELKHKRLNNKNKFKIVGYYGIAHLSSAVCAYIDDCIIKSNSNSKQNLINEINEIEIIVNKFCDGNFSDYKCTVLTPKFHKN